MAIQPDAKEWEALYASMGRSVRGKIRRLLTPSGNSTSSLDDVCQQFWMHLWRVGPPYWNPKGVNLISRQIVFKWLRKNRASVPIIDRIDGITQGSSKNWHSGRNYDTAWFNYWEPQYERSELIPDYSKISALLLALPAEQRVVFCFRYQIEGHEELSFNEIGQRIGVPPGEAVVLFCQAMKNIRNMLGEVTNA